MAPPTDNVGHLAVCHFQFSAFLVEEQVFHLSHWKDNLVCLTFLVSLEICGHKDLGSVFPTQERSWQGSNRKITLNVIPLNEVSNHGRFKKHLATLKNFFFCLFRIMF